ncbi:cytochrome P450 [Aspergillus tanneri]|uniref:Uncharacterized protein n=1 Tax=Aspergillus tanneri TaxID=1220188 RepID=A0A5M9MY51_9EURO|nr:uncharacterized protein ATNIH1004_002250 [Aspergillus tanneri]KAA8649579.1 hypothetical protein ATNIH1004_002250 [Aspergillus tanneri]
MSNTGEKLVLPPRFAEEMRNDDRLDAREANKEDMLGHVPCLAPLTGGSLDEKVIAKLMLRITRALNTLTGPMLEEIDLTVRSHWTDRPDFHEIDLAQSSLQMISQVSSRAFTGQKLCRNKQWINTTAAYSSSALATLLTLHLFPKFLHPLLQLVLPTCRETQDYISAARHLLTPVLEERESVGQQQDDAIAWFQEVAAGSSCDPVSAQLSLSFVATQTTADFFTNLLTDLCENPDLVPALRHEIISIIGKGGMTKKAISQLKLLDSVMKESQRMRPPLLATMGRRVVKSITLSNGLKLPKGTRVCVSTSATKDPSVYHEPERFDGYRFLKMRTVPGQENCSQFVATSTHSMGFGHGVHACPGRFLAGHVVKIFLCHILIKYDFRLPGGHKPDSMKSGFFVLSDAATKLLVRRRFEEI